MNAAESVMSVDLVEQFATPTGLSFMLRAKLCQGAVFRPLAIIHRRTGRLVAEIFFTHPIGPERQDAIVVPLWLRLPGEGA